MGRQGDKWVLITICSKAARNLVQADEFQQLFLLASSVEQMRRRACKQNNKRMTVYRTANHSLFPPASQGACSRPGAPGIVGANQYPGATFTPKSI